MKNLLGTPLLIAVVWLTSGLVYGMAKPPDKKPLDLQCLNAGYIKPHDSQVKPLRASGNGMTDAPLYRGLWLNFGALKDGRGNRVTFTPNSFMGYKLYSKPFSYSKCTYIGTAEKVDNRGQVWYYPAKGTYLPASCPDPVTKDVRN